MKGILKKVELKEYKTKEGKKFKKFNFEVDVNYKDEEVKTLKGSYGEQFAREYFTKCNIKVKELIGKEVGVVLAKKFIEREDGSKYSYEYIKFLNVLDENGKPVVFKKEENGEIDF